MKYDLDREWAYAVSYVVRCGNGIHWGPFETHEKAEEWAEAKFVRSTVSWEVEWLLAPEPSQSLTIREAPESPKGLEGKEGTE